HDAINLVDRVMDENFAPEPRMKPIENLPAGGPVGVLKPRSTTNSARIKAAGVSAKRRCKPFWTPCR
ncbi:MAG: hypothetical protein WBO09_08205, partial [Methylocystis silviterrae]